MGELGFEPTKQHVINTSQHRQKFIVQLLCICTIRTSKYKAGGVLRTLRFKDELEVKNDGQKWPIEDANVETQSELFFQQVKNDGCFYTDSRPPCFLFERGTENLRRRTDWLDRDLFLDTQWAEVTYLVYKIKNLNFRYFIESSNISNLSFEFKYFTLKFILL